jgi:iron complex transport system substrate-binding protein
MVAIALAFAAPPGGARAEARRDAGPVVTDSAGTTVVLAAAARRVISLAPHATEFLFAIGAGDRTVGVLPPADWPPEADTLVEVGSHGVLDLERIVALRPDLVIAWPYAAPAQTERLRAMGIPVYESNPRTPEDIAVDMERIGVLTGSAAQAARAASSFRLDLARLQRHAGQKRVRVFYEIWPSPLYTLGGGHWFTAALTMCGAENVFGDLALPAPVVTVEAVLSAKPDAIIAGTDGGVRPAWLDDWRHWPELPAVAHGNLSTVDANLLHRAGPRFVRGAEALCAVIDDVRQRGSAPLPGVRASTLAR